jgi:hypothetical protein
MFICEAIRERQEGIGKDKYSPHSDPPFLLLNDLKK